MKKTKANRKFIKPHTLSILSAAALVLPGISSTVGNAADEDSIDFQYSHYQEGKRESISVYVPDINTGVMSKYAVANNRSPIEVDSIHGSARVSLTDRVKFAFNYTEDTWSGATPIGSAPEQSGANGRKDIWLSDNITPRITVGASPFASSFAFLDPKGGLLYGITDPLTGETQYHKDRAVHVMSYASPETRKQGDFKLSYEWGEAALSLGGGISTERDYESRFVNLGGRMDFDQKQTTVGLGLSYTNSAISAVLDPTGDNYFSWSPQQNKLISTDELTTFNTLRGNREDWGAQLNLSQVINPNALMNMGMAYTRSSGFLENPYKLSWIFGVDPDTQPFGLPDSILLGSGEPFIEQRPDERNLFNWSWGWAQFIAPLDAALHFNYQFAHDDWGINAHTFDADWVQPIAYGWTVKPHIRYYSQGAADFYQPFFVVEGDFHSPGLSANQKHRLPESFSSDPRLSGYGTLSGGLTVAKQFAKGLSLEAGVEYYTHQGGLKLGGSGEGSFANFDYWVANAALKVNLSALGQGVPGSNGDSHHLHGNHPTVPAGILFGHTLERAGDMMAGYRHMYNQQAGDFLHGEQDVTESQILSQGCPGSVGNEDNLGNPLFDGPCKALPRSMVMSMHMLDLMYAPTDWLTLMLMPQFVDMTMDLYQPGGQGDHSHAHVHGHESGGIGDTGMYALVKLFDRPHHHLHVGLGVTAPSGDVGVKLIDRTKDLAGAYVHYGMQLGSGTWDFKPSLTYTGKFNDWSWGAQVGGTKRLEDSNASGFALGDIFETSVWGGYDLTHWLSATVRAAYTWQGSIKGRYPRSTRRDSTLEGFCNKADFASQGDTNGDGIPDGPLIFDQVSYNACLASIEETKRQYDATDRPTPMDFPANYGGHYVDIGFGLSATVPSGVLAGNKLSFEWLQPVYTNVNGYQLDRDGALSFTWSYGF